MRTTKGCVFYDRVQSVDFGEDDVDMENVPCVIHNPAKQGQAKTLMREFGDSSAPITVNPGMDSPGIQCTKVLKDGTDKCTMTILM